MFSASHQRALQRPCITYNEICDMPQTSRQRLFPPFIAAERVIPHAMIDRVSIAIGDWAVIGPPVEVVRFLDAIPEIEVMTAEGELIQAFNRTKRSPDGRYASISVKTGSPGNVAYQKTPVFSGQIVQVFGRNRVPTSMPGEYLRLGFDGYLNLNRFISAQAVRPKTRLDCPRLVTPLATTITGRFAQYEDEYCLTNATNVVIGPDLLYRYILSKSAEEHFREYLGLIEGFLTYQLQSIASRFGVTVRHLPYYSLRMIEFCYEFYDPNPIRRVESLDVPMRALGPRSRRHMALVRGERLFVYQDSIAVGVELSAGCDLVIYAKTNRRMRFEIRFDSNAIDSQLSTVPMRTGRTTRTHSQVRSMVAHLRSAAEDRLGNAFEMLYRQLTPRAGVTVVQLCSRIGRILQDDSLADTLINVLRMRGSLASAQGSPLKAAAESLVNAGILQRAAPRSEVFVPTDPYMQAVQKLR